MSLSLSDYAEEGLNRLRDGSPGISINALNKEDLNYLLDFYKTEGFDVKEEEPISKESVGIIYPITVFHNRIPVERGSHA